MNDDNMNTLTTLNPNNPNELYTFSNITLHENNAFTRINSDVIIEYNNKETKFSDLLERIETIEQRLKILNPDKELLENFEGLRKAYDHYKLIESLVIESSQKKV